MLERDHVLHRLRSAAAGLPAGLRNIASRGHVLAKDWLSGKRTRYLAAPLFVLALGLLSTLLAALQFDKLADARDKQRFDQLVADKVETIVERMRAYHAVLRGAAGLMAAKPDVSRADWQAYVARTRVRETYPGYQGIGLALSGTREELDARLREAGFGDTRLRPDYPRAEHTAIVYLEPLDRRNKAAIGFDMFTEPVRREAMARARDSGWRTLSGKVELVQEIDEQKQPGFLLYTPVYAGGTIPDTVGERRRSHIGWTYSPFRAGDFFTALFPARRAEVAFAVYDGDVAPANLLYASAPDRGEAGGAPSRRVLRQIDLPGRSWTLAAASTPAFDAQSTAYWTRYLVALGLLATALVTFATLAQSRATRDADLARQQLARLNATLEERVEQRTAALAQEMRQRHEAEDRARQLQKMEAIGQLTGGIAHDFNNMLAVVLGSLRLLERRLARGETNVQEFLDGAKSGAERAAALTKRLLAFGRRQPLAPEAADANKLLAGMSDLVRRTLPESISIELVQAGGLWRTYIDASELENAVLNLVVNARDAMPDGGRITIETANAHLDESYARENPTVTPGQYVLIAVADTGPGMSPEVAARAFDPFFTTKPVGQGTGLGLSQVYGFIKQSGGHIKLYSEPGQGLTVKLYLPRHFGVQQPQHGDAVPTALPTARREELILVVEDDPQVLAVTLGMLQELGYRTISARGGAEALKLLDAHPETRLLLTDVVMPEMNGRRLSELALARQPKLKVLFTTGYARNAIVHHGVLDPGVALIMKPFSIEALAHKIEEVLHQRKPDALAS